jgi:HTH-type transcriptional regulator/antitoxin HigA
MERVRVIKTEQDHQAALDRLMALMDQNPDPGSEAADELDVLSVLIEHYEDQHYPRELPDPVEAIRFRMDQQGLTQQDLVPFIGSASKVSEVLSGKRPLSLQMIRRLHHGLGIPADVLVQKPGAVPPDEDERDWQSFPLAEMRKRDYFHGFTGSIKELRETAEDWLRRFFDMTPGGVPEPAYLRSTAHLRTNKKAVDSAALTAWQARVLQKAAAQRLPAKYQPGAVDGKFMRRLAEESWSEQSPLVAREFLAKHGIHLVVERHLPRTYLDGAACRMPEGTPVIALTLRHDRLDNFWFTLMHELAHIALHFDESEVWFLDDLESEHDDPREAAADALAREALIPAEEWKRVRSLRSRQSVIDLAAKLRIHPCIVAGRIRKETGDYSTLGHCVRSPKVRYLLEDRTLTP